MLNRFSKYYFFSFWLLLLGTLHSQYDTTHYIPYLTDLTGNKSLASLERNASVYNYNSLASRLTIGGEGSGGAYIMFSTFEPGPFYVRIYKRNSSGTDWQQMKIKSISPGSPFTWKLSFAETEEFFRYPMYFAIPTKKKAKNKFLDKFNNGLASNRQISESTPNPIDYRYGTSWLNTDDHGLKIVADKNIYVRVVLKNDTDEYRDKYNYKYGEGTNTHGSAFSSKGIGRGAGTEFYTAHFYSQKNKNPKPGDQDFISVMSLEDGNTITLDSQRAWHTPLGKNTVTLDEGESVIFKRSWTNSNHSLGTRIYSTNDKEMVVTSGSWGGG